MADIAASEVVYTYPPLNGCTIAGRAWRKQKVTVTFPNAGGGTDYPAGGVPLTMGKLGFRNFIATLRVVARSVVAGEADPDWIWDGNNTAPKLLAFAQLTAAHQAAQLSTALVDKVLVIATPQVLTLEVSGW